MPQPLSSIRGTTGLLKIGLLSFQGVVSHGFSCLQSRALFTAPGFLHIFPEFGGFVQVCLNLLVLSSDNIPQAIDPHRNKSQDQKEGDEKEAQDQVSHQ